MKYTAIIAYLDDVPDSHGETLSQNVKLPKGPVPVSIGFIKGMVGTAIVNKENDKLIAEFDISLSPEMIEPYNYCGVIGGNILARSENSISEWELTSIGLTIHPSDKRLPPLKRKF